MENQMSEGGQITSRDDEGRVWTLISVGEIQCTEKLYAELGADTIRALHRGTDDTPILIVDHDTKEILRVIPGGET